MGTTELPGAGASSGGGLSRVIDPGSGRDVGDLAAPGLGRRAAGGVAVVAGVVGLLGVWVLPYATGSSRRLIDGAPWQQVLNVGLVPVCLVAGGCDLLLRRRTVTLAVAAATLSTRWAASIVDMAFRFLSTDVEPGPGFVAVCASAVLATGCIVAVAVVLGGRGAERGHPPSTGETAAAMVGGGLLVWSLFLSPLVQVFPATARSAAQVVRLEGPLVLPTSGARLGWAFAGYVGPALFLFAIVGASARPIAGRVVASRHRVALWAGIAGAILVELAARWLVTTAPLTSNASRGRVGVHPELVPETAFLVQASVLAFFVASWLADRQRRATEPGVLAPASAPETSPPH